MSPTFSVVVPLFNREGIIAACLESVLAQDFVDFEIVVVDDGSGDDGAAVVERMADPRIRCIRQPNGGANSARNRGIDEAQGRYVALLDSDDFFLPGHLRRTAAALAETPEALVFSRIIVDRGEGRSLVKPPRGPSPGENIGEYLFCDQGFTQTSTLALDAETARRVRFLPWLKSSQDSDFAVRLAAAGVPFRMIEEPGAIWTDRHDPGRVSARSRHETPLRWCEEHRGILTPRAYHAFRGWVIAKHLARAGRKGEALCLYAVALRHRCWRPALALRIFAQIAAGEAGYRRLADVVIGGKPSFAAEAETPGFKEMRK